MMRLVLALLAACSDSHSGPKNSTETGNPPVIDVSRIALVLDGDDVHVVGERKAVKPGGIELEVERLATGATVIGEIEGDGSFDVRVAGTLDDRYRLRALSRAPTRLSQPVYLDRDGATTEAADAGTLRCDELQSTIEERLFEFATTAEQGCETTADCTLVEYPPSCRQDTCDGIAVSYSGRPALQAGLDTVSDVLCADAERQDCLVPPLTDPLICAAPGPVACVNGRCTICRGEPNCTPAVCDSCNLPEISWGGMGPRLGTAHILINCTRYTASYLEGPQCNNELPCVAQGDSSLPETRQWTASDLQSLLGEFEIQLALRVNAVYGPNLPAGTGVGITIGSNKITIIDGVCVDGDQACKVPPPEVVALRRLLENIAAQQACPRGAPSSACGEAFDAGSGDERAAVWTFDSRAGACVPRTYNGAGGNANRFTSRDDCHAACDFPPPTIESCEADGSRRLAGDVCLQCGAVGGCIASGTLCVKRCETDEDCEGELDACASDGTCHADACP